MKPKNKSGSEERGTSGYDGADDSVLAVLSDERNGRAYYVSFLDTFVLDRQTYSVMYNYRPGDSQRQDPEIVIMRSWKDENGDQIFSSVSSKKELDRAFDFFYRRYAESLLQ